MNKHFDNIASKYDTLIPEHIRLHLLEKKTELMKKYIYKYFNNNVKGLDMGCGTGHYLNRMQKSGFIMSGFDSSKGMVKQSKINNKSIQNQIKTGSIVKIPFNKNKFDFAYCINVLHHLPSLDKQKQALQDIARILRPGGILFIHDMNTDNLLFKIYLKYIFPLTSSIDDDEPDLWVSPKWIRKNPIQELSLLNIEYFTFFPNFLPKFIFKPMIKIEYFLEKITKNRYGAHYMAVLKKN